MSDQIYSRISTPPSQKTRTRSVAGFPPLFLSMSITGLLTNILSTPNPKQVGPTNTTKTTTFTEKGKFHKANVRVCALKLTDLGSTSTSPIGLFSAPVKPGSGPKQRKEDAKIQDYYLNLGYAIRSLREDFPEIFYKEPNFDIYRDDIIFKDPLNKFIVGIDKYKSVLWALRFHGRIFFKALWINVLSIYQPTEGVIMLRWTVHGVARLPWESHGRFDGTSEYKLDRDGKELKNLRPQLYSAAEYCEKSYLHSEQKQMVLDNLKDYTVRALINAVDHLGTVAYKLTDILDQQTSDVNSMDLKVTSLSQQLLTCQTYTDKEGLRQQQLLAIIPRHHKRYILPKSVNKKVHFSPTAHNNPRRIHSQARPRVHPAGSPGSKTLSWHLASSETTPNSKATQNSALSSEVEKTSVMSSSAFHLLDNEESIQTKSTTAQPQHLSRNPAVPSSGLTYKDGPPPRSRPPLARSSQNTSSAAHNQIIRAPPRTKSMLSAFFVKQKAPKLKPAGTVA